MAPHCVNTLMILHVAHTQTQRQTRRESGRRSTRAASSIRSSGWHKSARCTSSSTPTSSSTVLDDPNNARDVDQAGRSLVDTRNGRRRRRLRLRLVDHRLYHRRHYHPHPRGCSRRRRRRPCRRPAWYLGCLPSTLKPYLYYSSYYKRHSRF